MKSNNSFVKKLIQGTKELSELTGYSHTLSHGNGVYGLDVGSGERWERSNLCYQQMESYLSGLILGIKVMQRNDGVSNEILTSAAEMSLCHKMNVSCKGEYVLRNIGTSEEWDVLISKEIKEVGEYGNHRQKRN